MGIIVIVIIGILCLLLICLFNLRQRYQYFKERNIPTPPFQFLFGHLRTLWSTEFYSRQLERWTQKYGKIYGIFEGFVPIYVISDVDLLQEIFIKQFSNFHGRKPILVVQPKDKKELNLLNSNGAQWRRQRRVCSPVFSDIKLKQMNSIFSQSVEQFVASLAELDTAKEEFDIYKMYKRVCLNMMCTAFGMHIETQKNLIDEYAYHTETLMSADASGNLIYKLIDLFPFLCTFLLTYAEWQYKTSRFLQETILFKSKCEVSPFFWLKNKIVSLFDSNSNDTTESERIDLLQLMKKKMTSTEIKEQDDVNKDHPQSHLMMKEEVASNALLFLTSGYLGPSVTLAYSTYVLANNPDVQDKLHKEIDKYFPDVNSIPDYDTVCDMPYLDLFLREVLRMWPVSISDFNRKCMTTTIINGIQITEGSFVQVDIYSINFNADIWGPKDPYIFYPERHEDKRHPCAYLSLGTGPRNCIGSRLALIEIKSTLIGVLRHYRIVAGEHLENNFGVRERIAITPQEIWIKLIKR